MREKIFCCSQQISDSENRLVVRHFDEIVISQFLFWWILWVYSAALTLILIYSCDLWGAAASAIANKNSETAAEAQRDREILTPNTGMNISVYRPPWFLQTVSITYHTHRWADTNAVPNIFYKSPYLSSFNHIHYLWLLTEIGDKCAIRIKNASREYLSVKKNVEQNISKYIMPILLTDSAVSNLFSWKVGGWEQPGFACKFNFFHVWMILMVIQAKDCLTDLSLSSSMTHFNRFQLFKKSILI